MDTKAYTKSIGILYFFRRPSVWIRRPTKKVQVSYTFFGGLRYGYEGLQKIIRYLYFFRRPSVCIRRPTKKYKCLIPFSEAFGMDTKAYKKV